jgi:hypothetical protein
MNKTVIMKILGVLIALSALADTHFELLKSVGIPQNIVDWLKLVGLIIALVLPSLAPKKVSKKVLKQ